MKSEAIRNRNVSQASGEKILTTRTVSLVEPLNKQTGPIHASTGAQFEYLHYLFFGIHMQTNQSYVIRINGMKTLDSPERLNVAETPGSTFNYSGKSIKHDQTT